MADRDREAIVVGATAERDRKFARQRPARRLAAADLPTIHGEN
jgi:hypothetical protein